MKLPERMNSTAASIYRLHESRRDERPRSYLGASEIGESCLRRLWLRFRWCESEQFEGRMLRLFDTGVREEARVLAELRDCGMEIAGEQHEVEALNGHFGGHLDAAVLGLVEAPGTWHVLDVKTAKASKFAEFKRHGAVRTWPKYTAQLQVYMGLTGMDRAALFVVCKDTDEIEVERFHFDEAEYERLMARAESVVFAAEPPPRISSDPAWYECKFCPFHAQCHGQQAPLPTCRSCAHSTPERDGSWRCEWRGLTLDAEAQQAGCEDHRPIPALVDSFLELTAAEGNVIDWRNKLTGALVRQPDYSSLEIRNAMDKKFLGDDFVKMMKTTFPGARVVPSEPQLSWQTFKNGTRHIRREVNGAFAGYVPQTDENMEAVAAQGNIEYAGDPNEIDDDLPWIDDEQNDASGGKDGVPKPVGRARRGARRVSNVP